MVINTSAGSKPHLLKENPGVAMCVCVTWVLTYLSVCVCFLYVSSERSTFRLKSQVQDYQNHFAYNLSLFQLIYVCLCFFYNHRPV